MKKLLSFSLCLFLLMTLALPALAQERTIRIRTAEDLTALSENCVSDLYSEGLTVILMNDVILDSDFSPIPLFQGDFEGNGYTVSGLAIENEASTCGLFRQVLEDGVVRNLHVCGDVCPAGSGGFVGGVVGKNAGTLTDCSFSGTVSGVRCVGGIVGSNMPGGVIERCSVSGEVLGQHRIGGVAGENAGEISACTNSAAVGTEAIGAVIPEEPDPSLSLEEMVDITDVGGVAGFSSGRISGCKNSGEVGYYRIGYNIGGIVGRQSGIALDCRNEAAVTGRKDVGGIVGQLDPDTEWRMDGTDPDDVKTRINALNQKMDALINDTENLQSGISAQSTAIRESIEKAAASAHALAISVEGWTSGNIAAVNDVTELIADTVDASVPVCEALQSFTDTLPPILTELTQTAKNAADAAGASSQAITAFQTALDDLGAALNDLEPVLEKLEQALDSLAGITSPADVPDAVLAAINQLQLALPDAETVLNDCNAAYQSLQAAAAQVPDIADAAEDTFLSLNAAFRKMNTAVGQLSGVITLTDELIRMLSERDLPSFAEPKQDSISQKDLFDAIGEINGELSQVSDLLTDARLPEDVRSILYEMTGLLNAVLDLFTAQERAEPLTEDVSSEPDSGRTKGIISACTNTGDILADTNVGGVVGSVSIDLDFDREDQLNISEFLTGRANYLIYASVSDCRSYSDVTAATASGGIAGRMDCGAVRFSSASGLVTASEQYSGGIAGYCRGTISDCMSRACVSAHGYCGGIAGLGNHIVSCLALPVFGEKCEFIGSIAGRAEGTVLNNYYAQNRIGGIDGFSFSGCAEPVSAEELLELAGADSVFHSVTVTFLVEGEVFAKIDVPYGGSIDSLPQVCADGDSVWQWDEFERNEVVESISVSGCYLRARHTISTGEEIPLFLAEGLFDQRQALTAERFDYAESLAAVCLNISDTSDGERFVFRMRAPSGGTLYTLEDDGGLQALAYRTDGNYLVFDGFSGMKVVYFEAQQSYLPWVLGGIAAAGLLAAAVLLIRRKSRKSEKKTAAAK